MDSTNEALTPALKGIYAAISVMLIIVSGIMVGGYGLLLPSKTV